MALLRLGRMEGMACTGVIYRFKREMQEAVERRNDGLAAILAEHGIHYIPKEFECLAGPDGNVAILRWDTEEVQTEDEPSA